MDVFRPRDPGELTALLSQHPEAALFAGGTDLIPRMRNGLASPKALILLDRIEALRGIHAGPDAIRIGACTPLSHILDDPAIRERLPVLHSAISVLGSPPVRNMATLGGNIVTASPAGDTLPPLHALRAEVELLGPGGTRRLPVREFITGPHQTDLGPGEVLAAVHVPAPAPGALQHFEKVGNRNAVAVAVASLAAILTLSSDGIVRTASLAWGSVAPTVLTCPEAEAALIGHPLDRASLDRAAEAARHASSPVTDLRADATTRRTLCGNLLLRLLLHARRA